MRMCRHQAPLLLLGQLQLQLHPLQQELCCIQGLLILLLLLLLALLTVAVAGQLREQRQTAVQAQRQRQQL
jgi:hypothetical protein